jgi:hypothetical protein
MGFKNDLVYALADSDVYGLKVTDIDNITHVTVSRNGLTHNFQFDHTAVHGRTAARVILERT